MAEHPKLEKVVVYDHTLVELQEENAKLHELLKGYSQITNPPRKSAKDLIRAALDFLIKGKMTYGEKAVLFIVGSSISLLVLLSFIFSFISQLIITFIYLTILTIVWIINWLDDKEFPDFIYIPLTVIYCIISVVATIISTCPKGV